MTATATITPPSRNHIVPPPPEGLGAVRLIVVWVVVEGLCTFDSSIVFLLHEWPQSHAVNAAGQWLGCCGLSLSPRMLAARMD